MNRRCSATACPPVSTAARRVSSSCSSSAAARSSPGLEREISRRRLAPGLGDDGQRLRPPAALDRPRRPSDSPTRPEAPRGPAAVRRAARPGSCVQAPPAPQRPHRQGPRARWRSSWASWAPARVAGPAGPRCCCAAKEPASRPGRTPRRSRTWLPSIRLWLMRKIPTLTPRSPTPPV